MQFNITFITWRFPNYQTKQKAWASSYFTSNSAYLADFLPLLADLPLREISTFYNRKKLI